MLWRKESFHQGCCIFFNSPRRSLTIYQHWLWPKKNDCCMYKDYIWSVCLPFIKMITVFYILHNELLSDLIPLWSSLLSSLLKKERFYNCHLWHNWQYQSNKKIILYFLNVNLSTHTNLYQPIPTYTKDNPFLGR